MRQNSAILRFSILLFVLWGEAGFASTQAEVETDAIAAEAIVSLTRYVQRFGSSGNLLYIYPDTGVLSENMLVGTATGIDICSDRLFAHTNFRDKLGNDVKGHFVLAKVGTKLNVIEYVFGDDPTLGRLQQPDCQYWSSDLPKLRLIPQPE